MVDGFRLGRIRLWRKWRSPTEPGATCPTKLSKRSRKRWRSRVDGVSRRSSTSGDGLMRNDGVSETESDEQVVLTRERLLKYYTKGVFS